MSAVVRLGIEAEEELANAAEWYEARHAGLGLAFLVCVEEARARMAAAPKAQPLVPDVPDRFAVRRCRVPRFPYWLVFLEIGDEIRILAIAHVRRRPRFWRGRR